MSSPADRYAASRRRSEVARTPLGRFERSFSFPLDEYQRRACEALQDGSGVLLAAPTGAGKTVVGEFAISMALAEGSRCFYTTPIKALSNQKFNEFQQRYGRDSVGLLTGDNSVNGDAAIVVMTTEILRNMLYANQAAIADLGYVVMDEVHYLADRSRGAVWEEVLINLPERVTIAALSATVSNAEEFGRWLRTVRGEIAVVVEDHRPVPLTQHVIVGRTIHDLFVGSKQRLNPDLIRLSRDSERHPRRGRGRGHQRRDDRVSRPALVASLGREDLLPAIDFVFSRAGCDAAVEQCVRAGVSLTSDEEAEQITRIAEEACAYLPPGDLSALNYGSWLHALQQGVAAHHAGLVPIFKEVVEKLFAAGLVRMVFATETLALGINMPARSVVIERLAKFNGEAVVDLTAGEYTQLTGRAGRRGIDHHGHAVVAWSRDLDISWLAGLASTRTYPLNSSFRPSYNMAVNLVASFGRDRAIALLETSFAQFQADEAIVDVAAEVRRNDEVLAGLALSLECDRGDFSEYADIRAQLSERERSAASQRRQEDREAAIRSLHRLRRGDVIRVPKGRRSDPAAVVETADPDRPEIVVVDIHDRSRRIRERDLDGELVALGRVRIPAEFSARSARNRSLVTEELRRVARDLPKQTPTRRAADKDSEIEELRTALRAHPCDSCPDREEHARVADRYIKLRRRNERLQRKVAKRTGTLAKQFDRICAVLTELGYLEAVKDDLVVTQKGHVLARIYGEADLIAAEAMGGWGDLAPDDLATLAAALVYESRRKDEGGTPRLPRGPVRKALDELTTLARDLIELEEAHDLHTLPELDLGLCSAMHRWANGSSLETVMWESELTAGDFVRWSRQVIDVLGQLAQARPDTGLALKARAAIKLIDRDVVAYSSVRE
ncbi:MAG: DEAD/DEAH box helicase [Actinobacteria bacterium]|nr:DEAD/DEAH box helicase [Actinomycetota bacterium]